MPRGSRRSSACAMVASEVVDALRELPCGRAAARRVRAGSTASMAGRRRGARHAARARARASSIVAVEGDARRRSPTRSAGPSPAHERFGTATRAGRRLRDRPRPHAPRALRCARARCPRSSPASLEEDLARRDVTVNAIAVAASTARCDAVPGALEDLEAGVLRVLHDALASPTTRRGCGASPATPRGSASRSSPRTARAGRTRPTRRRSAATASATSCASPCASRTRPPRCAPRASSSRGCCPRASTPDPPGLADALALLPPEGRRDLVTLAACGARAWTRARCWRWLDHMGFTGRRPRHGRRRVALGRPARRCARRARPREIARAARGRAARGRRARGRRERAALDRRAAPRAARDHRRRPPRRGRARRARRSASACAARWTASSTARCTGEPPNCGPRSSSCVRAARMPCSACRRVH